MNLLDWLLVLLVLAYALSGYWQGFVTGAFATAGLLVGGLAGAWLAPIVLGDADPSLLVSLGALFIVIVGASLGQAGAQVVGSRLRDRITWQPVRALDAVGGAALSAAAVLLVAWALGVAVSGSRIGGITPLVRSSAVLQRVDQALPQSATRFLRSFNDVVGSGFFPQYLEPFAPERITPVKPGDSALLDRPAVQRAEASVLKVRGSNRCGRGIEGSGFVYATDLGDGLDRFMTNAHVVAGVENPEIVTDAGAIPATVLYYNPDIDVAVLAFDGDAAALSFAPGVDDGQSLVILGYPLDGPFDAQAARVRSQQRLRSPNIYGQGTVFRDVVSLRGLVRPGNSGGPVLTGNGRVGGVVFAASVTDGDTGYALSVDQVADAAERGREGTRPVSTGGCAD